MPKHNEWNISSIISNGVGALTLLAVVFGGAGFYFKMKDLPDALKSEIESRQTSHKEEAEKREQLRTALINYADKTQHSIDSLAAHAMVQDEKISNVNNTLDKVVNGLQGIERAVSPKK